MGNYKENAEFVKTFLDGADCHYEMRDNGTATVFKGAIGGFDGLYKSFSYMLIVGEDEVHNYTMLPASAKARRPQIAEFVTRANYGLRHGSFEMGWDGGEVRFHMTIPMSAILAERAYIPVLIGFPAQMLNRYSKGFTEVLMDLKTPEDAIKNCEGD